MCVHDKYVITLKLREGVKVGMTAAQYLQNYSLSLFLLHLLVTTPYSPKPHSTIMC